MMAAPHTHEDVAALQPTPVFRHFAALLQTPRPSGELDGMIQFLKTFSAERGLQAEQDEIGNVVIRKAARPGQEKAIPVVLQCHMDMVCTKTPETEHDFSKDPIQPVIVGDWLKARGTTLGADNGLGLAAILAILEDPDLVHGPLHALFTVDEETTMAGAEFLGGPPFLPGGEAVLVNVDSEMEDAVCVGCVGGAESQIIMELEREAEAPAAADNCQLFRVALSGLLGGHSGVDIHLQRANGIKIFAEVLRAGLDQARGARVLSFSGGNAPNAIPSYASAEVYLPAAETDRFREALQKGLGVQERIHVSQSAPDALEEKEDAPGEKKEIPERGEIRNSFKVEVLPVTAEREGGRAQGRLPPLTSSAAGNLLDMIRASPHGVWRWSLDVEDQPHNSVSLGLCGIPEDDKHACLHFLIRSFDEQGINEVANCLKSLSALNGALFQPPFYAYRGWEPRMDAVSLEVAKKVYAELHPEKPEPHVYSIHAGLECGMFLDKYPGLDCVSIGPLITGAHSTDEQLKISTVGPFYDWLKGIVAEIARRRKTED